MTAPQKLTREHRLKTWPGPFQALVDGTKTFELRYDDRGYAVGDVLHLEEYEPGHMTYTGREMRRTITYRCALSEWVPNAPMRWVVLGLSAAAEPEAPSHVIGEGRCGGCGEEFLRAGLINGYCMRCTVRR